MRSPYKLSGFDLTTKERRNADLLGTVNSPMDSTICLENAEGDKSNDILTASNDLWLMCPRNILFLWCRLT